MTHSRGKMGTIPRWIYVGQKHRKQVAFSRHLWYNGITSLGGTATKRIHSVFCHPPTVAGGDIRLEDTGKSMKTILVLSILFCAIALPALGELTDADLDKIRLIVKTSESSLKEHTKSEIERSETRMQSYVDAKIESVKTPIAWLIGILVAMIAIIGLPLAILTIFLGWRSIKDNTQEKQIEVLTREIELLKQQRTVNP